jgi:hypothetical protein
MVAAFVTISSDHPLVHNLFAYGRRALKTILIPLAATGWLESFSVMAVPPSPISQARMSATVKTLASDAFKARAG